MNADVGREVGERVTGKEGVVRKGVGREEIILSLKRTEKG